MISEESCDTEDLSNDAENSSLITGLNGLNAQLHYFLNFSQLLVSCLPLLVKLINSGVSDHCCHDY